MPIIKFDSKLIFFVHIPKTGGASVETFFRKNKIKVHFWSANMHIKNKFPCSPQHYHSNIYKNFFLSGFFDYEFTIVRHPVERLKSEYRYRMAEIAKQKKTLIDFNEWINEIFYLYEKNKYILDNHIRPQNQFIKKETKVFKFEHGLENIIKCIASDINLNIEKIEVPHINKREKFGVTCSLDTLEKIYVFYKEDFEYFDYLSLPL